MNFFSTNYIMKFIASDCVFDRLKYLSGSMSHDTTKKFKSFFHNKKNKAKRHSSTIFSSQRTKYIGKKKNNQRQRRLFKLYVCLRILASFFSQIYTATKKTRETPTFCTPQKLKFDLFMFFLCLLSCCLILLWISCSIGSEALQ